MLIGSTRLGEVLREKTWHCLLLTANPHNGDPVNFSLFLQLLDQEADADEKFIHDAMERRETACYRRRTKEVMLNLPKPQTEGTWKAGNFSPSASLKPSHPAGNNVFPRFSSNNVGSKEMGRGINS
jgi:hypothetical protein